MGCDIHVMTEVLRNGEWVNADNWRLNPYYKKDEWETQEYNCKPVYSDRNYELFSFLAGVRNYGGNESFCFDRGFPEDAHKKTKEEYDSLGCDVHTAGYCTLEELKEAVKSVKFVRREGAVSKEQADRYRQTGETPDFWAQGVGCWKGIAPQYEDKYEWLSWTDEVHCFDKLLEAIEERKREEFWITKDFDDFSKDKDIRIVFWFDN